MKPPVWEMVTPERAAEWLNANNSNRSMTAGVAEKYAADMVAGRWTECVAPIVFYEDGDVADGQHRLWAVVEAGSSQRFLVLRDLPRPAGLNIDTGRSRNLVDNSRISGADNGLSNQLVAYARGIEDGGVAAANRAPRSNAELLDVVNRHRTAADWAMKHGPRGRGVRNAVVVSAIGRAYYVEADKDRLAKFSEVLSRGFSEGPADSAAVSLRNYLLMKIAARVSVVSTGNWRDTFLKAQNAIHYFMRGKSLTVVKVIQDEVYPLPGKPKKAPTTKYGQRAAAKADRRVAA